MTIRGFHHVALQVESVERTAAFYTNILGLREQVRHFRSDGSLRSVWIALGEGQGGFLALEQRERGPAQSAPETFLALAIDRADREAWLQRLARLGAPVEHQSRWTVYVRDPEGNRVGLSHYPEDPLS